MLLLLAHARIHHASAQLSVPVQRMIPREYDVLTGENNTLLKLFTLPSMPTYMGVAPKEQKESNDVLADMTWYISSVTGMVQLHPLVPLQYVYLQQHNGVVGGIWKRHHDLFARLIASLKPRHVVEIGGGHGYLAMKLLFSDAVSSWTMIDPNPLGLFSMPSLTVIKLFIEDVTVLPPTVDIVVHSHTLEHIYDPNAFFRKLRQVMPLHSHHVFSVPNLFELARAGAPCLHFEHTMMLSEGWVDWLLTRHGFQIVSKTPFGGRHSIFYVSKLVSKGEGPIGRLSDPPNYFREARMIARRWHDDLMADAAAAAAQLSPDRSLNFLYAAHVGSQFLLAAGLPASSFACVLDNNFEKVDARLYGTSLWVRAPAAIAGLRSPRVVLRQGSYNHEIGEQLRRINPSVIIIEPPSAADRSFGAQWNRTSPTVEASRSHTRGRDEKDRSFFASTRDLIMGRSSRP